MLDTWQAEQPNSRSERPGNRITRQRHPTEQKQGKAKHETVAGLVVDMKTELEKIREQVQNLE